MLEDDKWAYFFFNSFVVSVVEGVRTGSRFSPKNMNANWIKKKKKMSKLQYILPFSYSADSGGNMQISFLNFHKLNENEDQMKDAYA